jgi:hypothetical protein
MTRLLRNSAFAISLFMLSAALPIVAQVAQPDISKPRQGCRSSLCETRTHPPQALRLRPERTSLTSVGQS